MTAIYVIFYNPESNDLACESNKDYHEIRYYTCLRGFNENQFKVLDHRMCRSKKEVRNFEKKMPKMKELLGKTPKYLYSSK